jgi:hypothetical protein
MCRGGRRSPRRDGTSMLEKGRAREGGSVEQAAVRRPDASKELATEIHMDQDSSWCAVLMRRLCLAVTPFVAIMICQRAGQGKVFMAAPARLGEKLDDSRS